MREEARAQTQSEEAPPFGGSWKTIYTVVLINLAVLVALFYLFTRYFSG